MIDKIKAEIEFLKSHNSYEGTIPCLEQCLKWAEECEKEVKALFYNIKDKGYLKLEDIEKAFHSRQTKPSSDIASELTAGEKGVSSRTTAMDKTADTFKKEAKT